jgi:hypothetical protein
LPPLIRSGCRHSDQPTTTPDRPASITPGRARRPRLRA